MTTPRLHIKAACTLALVVVASATGAAMAASQGSHTDIGRILFRLRANAVICAMSRDSKALICFRPANGATARLARKGLATASLVKANRGVPSKATSGLARRKGHAYRAS